MRELDAFIANDPYRTRMSGRVRDSLSLRIFLDSAELIAAMRRLTAPSQSTKKLIQEIFPLYAQRGVVDLVKSAGVRLSRGFSPDFVSDLREYYAVSRYLDAEIFVIIMEALQRNKLMPIKEPLWNAAAHRVGLEATKRAMANVERIRR